MKIQTFINYLKKILKDYEKQLELDYINNDYKFGICYYLHGNFKYSVTFDNRFYNYYKHLFTHNGYLFPTKLCKGYDKNKINIENRIKFLKSEITRLERLKKKGYTHVM